MTGTSPRGLPLQAWGFYGLRWLVYIEASKDFVYKRRAVPNIAGEDFRTKNGFPGVVAALNTEEFGDITELRVVFDTGHELHLTQQSAYAADGRFVEMLPNYVSWDWAVPMGTNEVAANTPQGSFKENDPRKAIMRAMTAAATVINPTLTSDVSTRN